jgi:hypothetical protein
MKHPDTPFRRHWRYYIEREIVILAAAVALGWPCFEYRMSHGT